MRLTPLNRTSRQTSTGLFMALCLAGWLPSLRAALVIPGADGSDGALNITVSTNIDLSRAVTGNWDANNTANAGRGIYDLSKWAVVFKYSSVTIAPGATVTFSNHPSRAPVVWLVNGNVTIGGVLSLDGSSPGPSPANSPDGGPGGFRGGGIGIQGPSATSGFGPGGGFAGSDTSSGHFGEGFSGSYGSVHLLPLIGGSGGAGYNGQGNKPGTGGGGAILIAASETIAITGAIHANGGLINGNSYGPGSGGAVRLVADQISGMGQIAAVGGNGSDYGRIRLQANSASPALNITPAAPLEPPLPIVLWPSTNAAIVRVVSVLGQTAPNDPRAMLENSPADVSIATTNAGVVILETQNFPTNGTVIVFVTPRNGGRVNYQAAFVSGNTNSATWQVQHVFLPGYASIQARAVAQP